MNTMAQLKLYLNFNYIRISCNDGCQWTVAHNNNQMITKLTLAVKVIASASVKLMVSSFIPNLEGSPTLRGS